MGVAPGVSDAMATIVGIDVSALAGHAGSEEGYVSPVSPETVFGYPPQVRRTFEESPHGRRMVAATGKLNNFRLSALPQTFLPQSYQSKNEI